MVAKTEEKRKKTDVGKKPEQPPAEPNWLDLPREVTAAIISRLEVAETLGSVQYVCASWRSICRDPLMWRTIHISVPWYVPDMGYGLEVVCRQAIDLSHGGCVDINIEYFCTDELLMYITDRCNHIRRLRLVLCWDISNECLSEAVKRLPLLEDLEIWLPYDHISDDALESVKQCCPLLKSLIFNDQYRLFGKEWSGQMEISQLFRSGYSVQILTIKVLQKLSTISQLPSQAECQHLPLSQGDGRTLVKDSIGGGLYSSKICTSMSSNLVLRCHIACQVTAATRK